MPKEASRFDCEQRFPKATRIKALEFFEFSRERIFSVGEVKIRNNMRNQENFCRRITDNSPLQNEFGFRICGFDENTPQKPSFCKSRRQLRTESFDKKLHFVAQIALNSSFFAEFSTKLTVQNVENRDV